MARRNKVLELTSQGYNQSEISKLLQLSQPTINRDLSYLKQQAKVNIKRYIDERLPEEYEKCIVDDAIRFISSNKQQYDKEKAKTNSAPLLRQPSNDIQRVKQEDKQQEYAATTNKTF